ncbi:MAG: hypothetical protein L0Y56_04295, partial [Nitrospira sp.]|nr:hypothetical protein [Nitrospira sp.]
MIGYINNASGAILPGTPSGLDTSLSGFGQIASRPGESSFYEKVLGGWGLGYIGEQLSGLGQVVSEDRASFYEPGIPGFVSLSGMGALPNFSALAKEYGTRANTAESLFWVTTIANAQAGGFLPPTWSGGSGDLNVVRAFGLTLPTKYQPRSPEEYLGVKASGTVAIQRMEEFAQEHQQAKAAATAPTPTPASVQATPLPSAQPQPSTTVATAPTTTGEFGAPRGEGMVPNGGVTREFGAGRGTTAGRGTRMPNVAVVATPGTPSVQLSEEAELGEESVSVNQESFSIQAQELLGMVPGPSVEIGEFQIPWLLIGGVGALLLIP